MNKALETLNEELDKTSVISSSFKAYIKVWAMEAVREAYEKGLQIRKEKAK